MQSAAYSGGGVANAFSLLKLFQGLGQNVREYKLREIRKCAGVFLGILPCQLAKHTNRLATLGGSHITQLTDPPPA